MSASARDIMVGMGLRASDLQKKRTAKRAATPKKTKRIATSKRSTVKSSGDLPAPPVTKTTRRSR